MEVKNESIEVEDKSEAPRGVHRRPHERIPLKQFGLWTVSQRISLMKQLSKGQNTAMTEVINILEERSIGDEHLSYFTTKEMAEKTLRSVPAVRNALEYLEYYGIVRGKKLGKCILWSMIIDKLPRKK